MDVLALVLIPGEETFGNYNGATPSFLKQFKHQFYEEDGRFRFFGMLDYRVHRHDVISSR